MTRVTEDGRITVPRHVRDALDLAPGSEVEFVLRPGEVIVRKRAPGEPLRRWRGYLRGRLPAGAASVDDLMEALRGDRLPPEGERFAGDPG